ncbi:TapB family protein [Pedobacter arcticus]|uniref:TapB family protein n=1 Tax=Pedobacter arcticus TaxID=752140 RepID=UPI0002D8B4A0|nr:hypothetical protein [Pedobacter arcticus]
MILKKFRHIGFLGKLVMICLFALFVTSCKKDPVKKDTASGFKNFIPQKGYTYTYKFTGDELENATLVKTVTGSKDSLGTKVYELQSTFTYEGEDLHFKNKIYDLGGFTISTFYQFSEWDKFVKLLTTSVEEGGGQVLENKVTGVPYNLSISNTPIVGSDLKFTGGPTQFYFKASVGTDNNAIIETKQTITRHDGKATRKETIETPAGKFKCTVWIYNIDSKIENYLNGNLTNTTITTDKIAVWTAPGIGDVLTITEGSDGGLSELTLFKISK